MDASGKVVLWLYLHFQFKCLEKVSKHNFSSNKLNDSKAEVHEKLNLLVAPN